MPRRRRGRSDLAIAEAVIAVVAFVGFLSLLDPAVRQAIRVAGFVALVLVGFGLVALVALAIYRFIARRRRLEEVTIPLRVIDLNRMEPEVTTPPATAPAPEIKWKVETPQPVPQETPDLIEQLKKIDWFQFEKFV